MSEKKTSEKKRVLLIDDDADFLLATRLVLEKGGYEVHTAEDGASGLAKLGEVAPDLVITDMMMETWSEGFGVVAKIRQTPGGQRLPLILLSAVDIKGPYDTFEPSQETPQPDMVLHKPLKAEELLKFVGQLLA